LLPQSVSDVMLEWSMTAFGKSRHAGSNRHPVANRRAGKAPSASTKTQRSRYCFATRHFAFRVLFADPCASSANSDPASAFNLLKSTRRGALNAALRAARCAA
jgi:hypothetical protein